MVDFDDPHYKHVKGQIFIMDTQDENPTAVSVPIEGDLDLDTFRPHGLSLWSDPNTGSTYTLLYIKYSISKKAIIELDRYLE